MRTAYGKSAIRSLFVLISDSYLVRCDTSTQHRPDNLWIYIVRKDSEIVGIQSDILLEAAVFVVQVVRALDTVLFRAS